MPQPASKELLLHAKHDRYGLYINGRYVDSKSESFFSSLNPTDGAPWYDISDANEIDVDNAVNAARAALHDPCMEEHITQTNRGKLLRNLGDLIAKNADRLAEIETRDNGKLIKEMQAQMSSLPETYYYYAGMADKLMGETIPVNKSNVFNFTLREPLGVVGIIVPWNSPLYLLSNALAPSLAIGNTVVVKACGKYLGFCIGIRRSGHPGGISSRSI